MKKKKILKIFIILVLGFIFFVFSSSGIKAQEQNVALQQKKEEFTCFIYFTSLDCPHCAKVNPTIHGDLLKKYPNLVVIEYELSQYPENGPLLFQYDSVYGTGLNIPLVIFNKKNRLVGDEPILSNIGRLVERYKGNECLLSDGSAVGAENLDFTKVLGRPKIWAGKNFSVKPIDITQIPGPTTETRPEFTLIKILSLAAVDSINPCALAVLTLILISILTYNPENRKKVLWAGLGFCLSVFVTYFIYGLIIIRFFQLTQILEPIRFWLYKILGLLAAILGVLNIKDFFRYKPGGLATEMPMSLRPKVKRIISGITSPVGAVAGGVLVTVFLLPCTIGPYIICGGILCAFDLLKSLPWLLLYNLVFILPMAVITAAVYLGMAKAQGVSGWKDKNIKYLHLVSGVIILGLGVVIFFGLI